MVSQVILRDTGRTVLLVQRVYPVIYDIWTFYPTFMWRPKIVASVALCLPHCSTFCHASCIVLLTYVTLINLQSINTQTTSKL